MRAARLVAATLAIALSSCAYVLSVGQEGFEPGAAEPIEHTSAENVVLFVFGHADDLIGDARERFLDKCPGGTVSGVSSRLSKQEYILFSRTIFHLSGWCHRPASSSAAASGQEVESASATAR